MEKILKVLLVLIAVLPLNFVVAKNLNSLYGAIYQKEQTHRVIIDLPNSVFVKNKAKISSSYYFRLNVMANSLRQQPQKQIAIYSAGTKNLAIARSEKVKEYFIARGVKSHRIHVHTKIKHKPVKHVNKYRHTKKHKRHFELTTKNEAKWVVNKHGHIIDVDIIDVLFKFDRAVVNPKYYLDLNAVVQFLQQDKHNKAVLYGHTDSVGADSYNVKLSQRRAASIKRYLVAHGVNPHHVFTKGLGERNPVASNATRKGRALNRRVHVKAISQIEQQQKKIVEPLPVQEIAPQEPVQSKSGSYVPRLYLAGFGGYDDWTALGQGDLLAPIFSGNTNNFFLYGQGRYGLDQRDWARNPWTTSVGFGYRQMVNNVAVLGVYVLGDHSETNTNHKVNMISPGVEALGRTWDFRVNGYIPVGTHDWTQEVWASDDGDDSYVILDNHLRYDAKHIYHEEAGMGVDAEAGVKLFKVYGTLVKGYLDGYYFNMQHNKDIYGGGAHITIEPTTYAKIFVQGAYDTHNKAVIMGGLQLSIYDIFSRHSKAVDENDLQRRLFEPLQRNFATIGSGSTARQTGDPADPHVKPIVDDNGGEDYIKEADDWYFSPTNSNASERKPGDIGTPENPYPCEDFNAATLKDIKTYENANGFTGANLYFRSGTYSNFNNNVTIYNDFTLEGTDPDWIHPAQGNDRAVFYGAFNLDNGDNLENIRLLNLGEIDQPVAITVGNGATVHLDNISIGPGPDSNNKYSGYATDINLNHVVKCDISNSQLYAKNNMANNQLNAVGINMVGGGELNVIGSRILSNAFSIGDGINHSDNAYGIKADGLGEKITVDKSNISATGNNNSINNVIDSGNGYGILIGHSYYDSGYDSGKNNVATPVAYNELHISNSVVRGMGESNSASDSGNGYGVLVGTALSTVQKYITIDQDVHDNVITVDGASTLSGSGIDNAIDWVNNAGNGYGLLVGFGSASYFVEDQGGECHIHQAVYNNNISVAGNSNLLGDGHSVTSGDYSGNDGNGYGFLLGHGEAMAAEWSSDGLIFVDQSIHDNRINIADSRFIGTGKDSTQNSYYSGNGYGVVIGNGTVDASGVNSQASVDQSVYANGNSDYPITITNSEFEGTGDASGDHSGNGFGLLVGDGCCFNRNSSNITVNQSIEDNVFVVSGDGSDESIFKGTGIAGGGNYSSNGYGLLVGYGYANAEVNVGGIAIQEVVNNYFESIANYKFTGTGSAAAGSNEYSGNGYGLLVGYGYAYADLKTETWEKITQNVSASEKIKQNVYNNIFENIEGDNFTGTGSATGVSNQYSGNGYGLLVGYGYEHGYIHANVAVSGEPKITQYVSANIFENIDGNDFTGTGSAADGSDQYSGNAYGMLIGYGYAQVSIPNIIGIYNNDITVNNGNYFTATSENNSTYPYAAGISMGACNDSNIAGQDNTLKIWPDNDFTLTTNDGITGAAIAWGIYMPDIGILIHDGWNWSRFTYNKPTPPTHANGGVVHDPISGTIRYWDDPPVTNNFMQMLWLLDKNKRD